MGQIGKEIVTIDVDEPVPMEEVVPILPTPIPVKVPVTVRRLGNG